MSLFVDPRSHPQPPFTGPRPRTAEDPRQLIELNRLCRAGRIYDIEEWIRTGKPIHADTYQIKSHYRYHSPLAVAIDSDQFDVARLRLCNGAPADAPGESLLDMR